MLSAKEDAESMGSSPVASSLDGIQSPIATQVFEDISIRRKDSDTGTLPPLQALRPNARAVITLQA
jgi:hypothetical protein